MHLFSRFLSLRRRGHSSKKNKSRNSSGSSFEYGQPSVDRLSGDFDPYQYRFQTADRSDFDLTRSAGIPIRITTPRSFPIPDHPIDHVPRRDRNELASPRSVQIHRKKLLQRTEFPHAYPPRSPRKVSRAEFSRSEQGRKGRNRSIRRIVSLYSDSNEDLTFETSRLNNLRRDPSVLSLVSLMDSQGFISSDAFTNNTETPETTIKHHPPGQYARFAKSTPELSVRTQLYVPTRRPVPQIPNLSGFSSPCTNNPNERVNTLPETPPARPRSEFLLPSFPQNILPSQTRCATPESHSFSSLQVEPGSFSLIGDSTEKPALTTTHKSLARASDAFRFLEDRYNIHLPPTSTTPGRRGHSANDAVAESSLMSRQIATSRVSGIPFVRKPEGQQTLSSTNTTYNLSSNSKAVCFPPAGTPIANAPPGSHISHSRVISPLGSPLPVLTRIRPYSSSFSRSRFGTNQTDSTSEETAPSPSRSLWESSRYSPPSTEMSPRTPKTAELIQGLPEYNEIPTPAIVVSPSQASAYDYYQDKKLTSGSPAYRDADFADREVIRTTHSLHRTPGTLDVREYGCHVPTHSVYMQLPTRKDQHTRVIRMTRSIPIEEGRAGTGISFDFNLGDNVVNSDSVGDYLNNDQQEITPGRPTVVLVPAGRRVDRGEGPASASAPASVKPELDCEQSGPLFALGLDPHSQQAASQSAISCTDSFYTAREEFTIGDHPSGTNEFGVRTKFTRNVNYQSRQNAQTGAPKLNLDLSRSPLVATCGPAASVSSSRSQDSSHHGTQYIISIDRSARVSPIQTSLSCSQA
ncbi:unnamed protein product [Rhizoctonia solani]|uniref:Uncharacterized protein n=1 Tax=Rhizoctonia solani TaxID=456999 RepID=A0A8H3CHL5_9AGAM|nr:unnamed protein product [Rhizoctonia solani]